MYYSTCFGSHIGKLIESVLMLFMMKLQILCVENHTRANSSAKTYVCRLISSDLKYVPL